jgi:hypothetical protein
MVRWRDVVYACAVKLAPLALALCVCLGCSTLQHSEEADVCQYYVLVDGGLPDAGDGGNPCLAVCDANVACYVSEDPDGSVQRVSCYTQCP